MAYVTTLTYASTNQQRGRFACPLVSSSTTKPCQFSLVTSLCTRPHSPQPCRQQLNYTARQWQTTDTGLVDRAVCLFTPQLSLVGYSLHLPSEEWTGWDNFVVLLCSLPDGINQLEKFCKIFILYFCENVENVTQKNYITRYMHGYNHWKSTNVFLLRKKITTPRLTNGNFWRMRLRKILFMFNFFQNGRFSAPILYFWKNEKKKFDSLKFEEGDKFASVQIKRFV